MKELIEKLEKATGPDRELDLEIKMAHAGWLAAKGATAEQMIAAVHGDLYDEPAAYTASMDAALALVTEDWEWEIKTAPHRKGAICRLVSMGKTIWAEATTPATAICIAALRARNGGA